MTGPEHFGLPLGGARFQERRTVTRTVLERWWAASLVLALGSGCSHHASKAQPASSAAPPANASARAQSTRAKPKLPADIPVDQRTIPRPSGPRLAILAGKGVGPIRIGATVATIERLMAAKCDVLTPTVCRYIGRAVEFELKHGKTVAIHVERMWRPAGKDAQGKEREYGTFNGAIPPDIMLGMLPWAVRQGVGKPLSVKKVTKPNPFHTVEIDRYKGMTLEYDKLDNGKTVLGGIRIPK